MSKRDIHELFELLRFLILGVTIFIFINAFTSEFIGSILNFNSAFREYSDPYYPAVVKFWNEDFDYQFNYLPSFFLLSPFLINKTVYIIFLFICCGLCSIILIKVEENKFFRVLFSLLVFFLSFVGNIEPFVFLLLLLSIYYQENTYLPPILLSFICFKLSLFLVVPYFLYKSKNRTIFILLFCFCFTLYNIYFLFNIDKIILYYEFGAARWDKFLTLLRTWALYFSIFILTKAISYFTEEKPPPGRKTTELEMVY